MAKLSQMKKYHSIFSGGGQVISILSSPSTPISNEYTPVCSSVQLHLRYWVLEYAVDVSFCSGRPIQSVCQCRRHRV